MKNYFYIGKYGETPFPTWTFEEILPNLSGMYNDLMQLKNRLRDPEDRAADKPVVIEISEDIAHRLESFMEGEEMLSFGKEDGSPSLMKQEFSGFRLYFVSDREDFITRFVKYNNIFREDFTQRTEQLQKDMETFGALQELLVLIHADRVGELEKKREDS